MISLRAIVASFRRCPQRPQNLVGIPVVPGVGDFPVSESSDRTAGNLQWPCGQRSATVFVARRPGGQPTHEHVVPCGKRAFDGEVKVRKHLEGRPHGVAGGLPATGRRGKAGGVPGFGPLPPPRGAGGPLAHSPRQRPPPRPGRRPRAPPPLIARFAPPPPPPPP